MRQRLVDFYLTLDLRALGVYRILLALLLIHDWCVRWPSLEAFYTGAGLLPADAPVPQVGGALHWSLLDPIASPALVRLVFILGLAAYLCLLVGWRTKWAHVASFLFFASVRTRNALVSHGGDTVLVTMLLWTLFTPLGARFSIDSIRAALQRGIPLRRRDHSAPAPAAERSHPSLAALAIVMQIGLIYLATAAAKTGATWRDGTAVYYTLHLDTFATPLGSWLAGAPIAVLKALTWGTWFFEWSALPLLLLPVGQPWVRRIVLAGLASFHLGTFLTMTLGSFPLVMITSYVLLVLPEDWNRIVRFLSRGARRMNAYYDDTCGFCHRCCQVLALADRGGRIEFIGASERDRFQHPLSDEELQASLVVFDVSTGRKWTRARAVAALCEALPLPYRIFRLVALPGLVVLSDRVYDFVARHRYDFSRRMGFTACGIDRVPDAVPTAMKPAAPATPLRRLGRGFVQALVVYLMVTMVVDSWNLSLAKRSGKGSLPAPEWVRAPSLAFNLMQGWRLFAPDPLKGDGWWVADARTAEGNIDLLTGEPTRWEKPAHLATRHDVFWRAYLYYISQPRYSVYRPYFARWLVRQAQRDGRPRPTDFGLYYMQEDTLPPGTPRPFPVQQYLLWAYDVTRDAIVASRPAGP